MDSEKLLTRFDCDLGTLGNAKPTQRHLADLRGCFHDRAAYERALAQNNALIYTVAAIEPANGAGDLHYGLGTLYPGSIGDEYFLTKGHLHSWREAAEVYIGLRGEGMMLFEDEGSGESHLVPLRRDTVVYVPGHTAHRTVNVGDVPLVYLGVYPARAGHDYKTIAAQNFRSVVVRRDGKPHLLKRENV